MKVTTLKGIFPEPKPLRKNYIYENVKNLRRMEQCFQANKEVDELQKLQRCSYHKTIDKYQNVPAKVVTNLREKKTRQTDSANTVSKININPVLNDRMKNKEQKPQHEICAIESNTKHINASKNFKIEVDSNKSDRQGKQKETNKRKENYNQADMKLKVSSEPNVHKFDNINNTNVQSTVKYKDQGIQTLDIDQVESICSTEDIIRYPSEKVTKPDDTVSNANLSEQERKVLKPSSDSAADNSDIYTPEDSRKLDLRKTVSPVHKEVDFIKLNKEYTSVPNKLMTQSKNNPSPLAHYRKGVVPKYLKEIKEAQQREQKTKEEVSHTDCPRGHTTLPDHEREETLQLLKNNYQEYINELNKMPIKTDTLRAQRRKMEIEKQLTKLEEGIKVFSRPKVYLKINA